MHQSKVILEASNRITFKEFDVGDKLIVSHLERDLAAGNAMVVTRVEYGVVTGFDFNSYGEMLLVLSVVGSDAPSKLHPRNSTFTIKNISKER